MSEKFYITTAIDYVNAQPHIGHAYQKIVADVLARWNKILGKEVLFVTGTDEHGKKVEEAAKKNGKEVQEFVNEISNKFKEAWKALRIEPDRFIRTTDTDHQKVVEEFILKCNDNGDIYLGEYEGYYCTGCEAYLTEKDLIDGCCQYHKKPLEKIKEKSYFFRLSKYQDFLLEFYENNSEFILPEERRNEIVNRVKEGLKDLSISRTNFKWGIPFPEVEDHIVYVWFDALINYYSATRNNGLEKFWGKDTVHLLGKDNTWFHTVYWPAMLKSAGIELPGKTMNHGFLKFNSEKISKSLGNAISPNTLVEKYGADSIRYFVCRHFPFRTGQDGDFSEAVLVDRHNNELLSKLGNLVSRVAGLVEKNGIQRVENRLSEKLELEKIKKLMQNFEVDKALNEIFAFIDTCNEYVQHKKPWETHDKKVLYELVDSIKKISILLYSFMPSTCEKIAEKLGGYNFSIDELQISYDERNKIIKGKNLFEKLELEEKINKEEKIQGVMTTNAPLGVLQTNEGWGIDFEDWAKLDLRVAEIEEAQDIEGADKLYKLGLDVGELGKRTICAGIKENYNKEELKGKKIIYFSNLKPRKMKGIESQGMLLAASTEGHKQVVLISPSSEIANGSRVG